jgi:hypothetical protein
VARGRKTQVRDVDRGYAAMMRRIAAAERGAVRVGLRERDARRRYPSGVTVGQVALWQEQGTATAPRRPFLSGYMDLNSRRIGREVTEALRKNVRRGDAERRLGAIADEALRGVRAAYWRLRPLAPSTVEGKGSRRPMVDTGLLDRSLSGWAEVEEGGSLLGRAASAARGALGRLLGR